MSDSNEDVCPVCGQEYVHKREEMKGTGNHVLRDDFEECRVNRRAALRSEPNTVYVHEPTSNVDVTRETVVKHVNRDSFVSGDRKLGNRELIQSGLGSQESGSSGTGTGGISNAVQEVPEAIQDE